MNKKLRNGFKILLLAITLFRVISSFNLNNENLMLYVTCDQAISDSSANNIEITNVGVTFTVDRHNVLDACNFSGSAYLHGSASLLPTTDRTITFWFRPDVLEQCTLLSYGDASGDCTGLILELNYLNTPPKYLFQPHCNTNVLSSDIGADTTVLEHKWTFFAFTAGASGSAMYKNGTKIAQNSIPLTTVTDKEFSIGVATFPDTGLAGYPDLGFLVGAMDEIRIYSSCYSDADILDIYNQEKNSPPLVIQATGEHEYKPQAAIAVKLSTYITDPDGDTLTYIMKMADGSTFPNWLFTNGDILSSTGNVPGIYNIVLQAQDKYITSPEVSLKITITGQTSCSEGYVLIDYECFFCQTYFPNCATCQGINKGDCLSCQPGYTLWSNKCNNCASFDSHCSKCSASYCITCSSGYSLDSYGKCKLVCYDPYCAVCQGPNEGDCIQCASGYNLVNLQCINCPALFSNCSTCKGTKSGDCTSCISGYTLNSNGSCQYACPDSNCVSCSKSACTKCKDGYGISYSSKTSCTKCTLRYCLTCEFGIYSSTDKSETCTKCQTNYEPSLSQASPAATMSTLSFPSNSFINTCIEIIRYCTDSQCINCSSRISDNHYYFLKGSTCKAMCSKKNCMECNSEDCTECFPGYNLYNNECYTKNCRINCDLCTSSTTYECAKCSTGYFLSSNGECSLYISLILPIILCVVLIPSIIIIISCIAWYRRHRLRQSQEAPVVQAIVVSNELHPNMNNNLNRIPNNNNNLSASATVINPDPNFNRQNNNFVSNSHHPVYHPDNPNPIPNQLIIRENNWENSNANPIANILSDPNSDARALKQKRKCVFCPSIMIFGKAQCKCYLCYRHCNDIRIALKNNQVNKQCPIHLIMIDDVYDVDDDLHSLPTFEEIVQARRKDTLDNLDGKCQICFEQDCTTSFKCGCKAMVCSSCFDKHVSVYKHDLCPFCRRKVNGIK